MAKVAHLRAICVCLCARSQSAANQHWSAAAALGDRMQLLPLQPVVVPLMPCMAAKPAGAHSSLAMRKRTSDQEAVAPTRVGAVHAVKGTIAGCIICGYIRPRRHAAALRRCSAAEGARRPGLCGEPRRGAGGAAQAAAAAQSAFAVQVAAAAEGRIAALEARMAGERTQAAFEELQLAAAREQLRDGGQASDCAAHDFIRFLKR